MYDDEDSDPEIHSYLMSGYHRNDPADSTHPQQRWIEIFNAEGDTELRYWVALHEFAHVLNGDAAYWGWNNAYDTCPGPYEARAWTRAFEEARFYPSERVLDQVYYKWFGTYTASPGFSVDDPDIKALFHYLEVETVE